MIEGSRIALGPILPNDLPNLFIWGDDPAIARLNEPYVPKNLQRESDFWLNAAGDATRVFFAVRSLSSPEILGHVQVTAIDPIHRSASVGILIGKAGNRGRGYGKEAMQLVIDYCWRTLNLSRLSLNVHATNAPAVALYEALGFETEGVLRSALFIDGAWIDLKLMAIMQPGR
jgi:RimJ/RimL family protein N-acetyltransferase